MESGQLIVRELRVGELKCTFSLSGVYLQVSEESIKDTFNSLWLILTLIPSSLLFR